MEKPWEIDVRKGLGDSSREEVEGEEGPEFTDKLLNVGWLWGLLGIIRGP